MASTAPAFNPYLTSCRTRPCRPRVSASLAVSTSMATLRTSTTAAPSVSVEHSKLPVERRAPLASVWREIQGSGDWEDLVEPLNHLLRDEIVRYGEFVVACYKAFDLESSSRRYLNCKYGKSSLLREVGMADSGYEITKFIYARPDISVPMQGDACPSRWIGYVAVSSDDEVRRLGRRDILVAFRGTVTNAEWMANFMSSLTPARLDPQEPRPEVKVESGFLSLYTSDDGSCRSCREQLLSEIVRLINKYKDEELSITLAGHSMGSSLALLLGYDLAELGLNRDHNCKISRPEVPITVYSFGGPRVGNSGFKKRCEELGVKVLRVVNVNDPVTKVPGVFLNENFTSVSEQLGLQWSCSSCYAHVGVELALDFFKMRNPACVHDLDAYITGLLKTTCPKMVEMKKNGFDLANKARIFLSDQGSVEGWQYNWQDAAWQIGNLVQTLGI